MSAVQYDDLTCALCGKQMSGTYAALDGAGWSWWTGYNPARQAACPNCLKRRRGEVNAFIDQSRIKPEDRK